MYLKSLSLRGFKSFADKAILEFDPLGGITAIVGPNGCGKSNLVDAVRWVLGEHNPKELRSAALEEVIFAGTVARKSLSLAEVNIVLDNSDNKIKSEFSEISIKRRTYRSGESEFQINKANCRLKDIRDLFLDTGLGDGSYSIISQGQVDEILSSKPEDRRRVFEEAAKINKYKFRKKAAERKLISTEQNLLRISDLKGEISNQLSTLSIQAEKAGHYNQLKNALKDLEIGISKRLLKNFNDRKENICAKIEELKMLGGKSDDLVNQTESEKNKNKERLKSIEREIENLRLEISQEKLTYEESKSEILLNKEKERYLEEQLKDTKRELETLLPQLETLKNTLESKALEEKGSKERLDEAEKEFNVIKAGIENIITEQNKLLGKIDISKSEIFDLEGSLSTERNNLVELESNIRFVNEEAKRDNDLLNKLKEENDILISENNNVLSNVASVNNSIKENKDNVDKTSKILKAKQAELAALQDKFMEKKGLFDSKSSKYSLLLEFQKSHEGYPKGIKEALRAGDQKTFGTVYGTVAEQIKVDPEHETAISAALSYRSLNIIVENDETAQAIIQHLKSKNLGRATFIPLNLIKDLEPRTQLPAQKGIIDFASNLTRTDKKFSGVIEYLLGKTIVVDNLRNAIEISKKRVPFKIVTLEGESIPNYGSITGGSLQKTSSLFGREREILLLEEEIKQINVQLEQIKQEKVLISSEISTKENELRGLFETDSRSNIEVAKLNQTIQLADKKMCSVKEEIEMILNSVNARSKEAKELENKKQVINSRILKIDEKIRTLDSALKIDQDKSTAEEEKKESLAAKLTDMRVVHSNTQINVKHISEEIISIQSNIKNLESMISPKSEKDIKEKLDITKKDIVKLENSLPRLQEKENDLLKKVQEMHVEKEIVQTEISSQEEKLRSETQQEFMTRDALSKEEISLAKIDSEIVLIEQKMLEEYKITLEQIVSSNSEITNTLQAKEEINGLKQQLAELGLVNLLAIEEHEKAKERISFIDNQCNDLMIARENLSNLIRELDNKAKIEFLNTIKIVNEHFSNIFASLFEGGEAKITLSSDENILEGGIEIIAKPGGKKWLSLSVMSGGERSLTAIALLFALIKAHPSPFCFLDEVDAALDEANVHRFTKMLKDFSKSSQIILITHNKQTMSIANTLYGITMEEPGASKVISVKFSKVAA